MGKRTGKNRKTDGRAGYGKRVAAVGMMFVMLFSFAACGKTTASEEAEALSGSCIDILNKVYETADLDESMRDAMQDYEMTTIDADMEEYVLGTDEITYTDSAYSAPMMTSVAYLRGSGERCGGEHRGCDFICHGLRRGRVCNKRCISCIGRMRWMQLRNNKLLM